MVNAFWICVAAGKGDWIGSQVFLLEPDEVELIFQMCIRDRGKKVRVMEDKMAGRYSMQSDGQVDVYIERDDHGQIVDLKSYRVQD